MIKYFDIENITCKIANLKNNLKKIKSSIIIDKRTIENFVSNELPLIASSAGASISKPFFKKSNYNKKFREYNLPSNLIAGIHTGETYYALSNMTSTKNITIIKSVSRDSIEYGYTSDYKRNFNIGVTNSFIESETIGYRDIIVDKIFSNI